MSTIKLTSLLNNRTFFGASALVALGLLVSAAAVAEPLGTAFTYQGQLKFNGSPVNDSCDFNFWLFDEPTGGTVLGSTGATTSVSNGIFTVEMDFGAGAFNGDARWLEIAVRCPPCPFICTLPPSLSPRQPINAVPYAHGLRLPFAEGVSSVGDAFAVTNTAADGVAVRGVGGGNGVGVSGTGHVGVIARSTGRLSVGVDAEASGFNAVGVSASGWGWGVRAFSEDGFGVHADSLRGYGILGTSNERSGIRGLSNNLNGVEGVTRSEEASGVYGENSSGGYGVAGRTSGTGTAVLGDNPDSAGWAGYFNGRVGATGKVIANGGYQTGGADVAERIESTDRLEPGDVVEIDPDHRESFRRASTPYSTLTAGIISTAPGVLLNSDVDAEPSAPGSVLALAGRVPVKVTTANGPIKAGDLLTTSALPGHAMRCDDRGKCAGAIIGKALESWEGGTGTVKALVMLQ